MVKPADLYRAFQPNPEFGTIVDDLEVVGQIRLPQELSRYYFQLNRRVDHIMKDSQLTLSDDERVQIRQLRDLADMWQLAKEHDRCGYKFVQGILRHFHYNGELTDKQAQTVRRIVKDWREEL